MARASAVPSGINWRKATFTKSGGAHLGIPTIELTSVFGTEPKYLVRRGFFRNWGNSGPADDTAARVRR